MRPHYAFLYFRGQVFRRSDLVHSVRIHSISSSTVNHPDELSRIMPLLVSLAASRTNEIGKNPGIHVMVRVICGHYQ